MGEFSGDFEFERRFFVSALPHRLLEGSKPDVIVQTYFLAKEGYGLRVRLQATQTDKELPLDLGGKAAEEHFLPDFDLCMLTVKGPAAGGTRYELAKRRWAVWLHEDGWNIDQFAGENYPLKVAECERTSPVTDLTIPSFCTQEITDDLRFSNDELVNAPFSLWGADYLDSLSISTPPFKEGFGQNKRWRM